MEEKLSDMMESSKVKVD